MDVFLLLVLLFSTVQCNAMNTADDIEQLISALRQTYHPPIDVSGHLTDSFTKTHEETKNALLTMMCNFLTCTEWSDWSACGDVVGRFGQQTRTRECGQNMAAICREKAASMNIDTRPCMIDIPWCPLEFEYTRDGFCVKLFNETFLSWYDSLRHCKNLGGQLINIDSELKFENVQESLKPIDLVSIYAWVDGIKQDADSQWEMIRGSQKPVTFGSWYQNEAGDRTRYPQCRCVIRHLAKEPLMWCSGNVCENRENFICEIQKNG